MEVICLSCPEASAKDGNEIYSDINKAREIINGGKFTISQIFGSFASQKEWEQLKKYNINVGHLAISVILPNGENLTHRQEYYTSAFNITNRNTNTALSLYVGSILWGNSSNFKQKAVNEYMKKGYRAPQNEITKYLLNDGRELVMTRGK